MKNYIKNFKDWRLNEQVDDSLESPDDWDKKYDRKGRLRKETFNKPEDEGDPIKRWTKTYDKDGNLKKEFYQQEKSPGGRSKYHHDKKGIESVDRKIVDEYVEDAMERWNYVKDLESKSKKDSLNSSDKRSLEVERERVNNIADVLDQYGLTLDDKLTSDKLYNALEKSGHVGTGMQTFANTIDRYEKNSKITRGRRFMDPDLKDITLTKRQKRRIKKGKADPSDYYTGIK